MSVGLRVRISDPLRTHPQMTVAWVPMPRGGSADLRVRPLGIGLR
jgi:hypothetical protein